MSQRVAHDILVRLQGRLVRHQFRLALQPGRLLLTRLPLRRRRPSGDEGGTRSG